MTDGIDACEFKKKCSKHGGCGMHTTQHFVFGPISFRLHGQQVIKNPTLPDIYSEEMYWLTHGEMLQCGEPQGRFVLRLWLLFPVFLFTLPPKCWLLPVTGHHISVWQHAKGKAGRIPLKTLPEKWMIDLET